MATNMAAGMVNPETSQNVTILERATKNKGQERDLF